MPNMFFSKEHVTERKTLKIKYSVAKKWVTIGYFAVATIEIRWKDIVQTSTKGDIFVASPERAVQFDCL